MFVNIIRFKVIDDRGRTVSVLSKRSYFDSDMQFEQTERWSAEGKPVSKRRPEGIRGQEGRIPRSALRRRGDQWYLELPGLTVKLENLEPLLDGIAAKRGLLDASGVVVVHDENAATLTTADLRRYTRS